jgi:hypothetical protein
MVVGDSVEALRQSYEVSRRQMVSIMEQQGRLRDAAEAMALNTRGALERVAESLCPGLVDNYCKASPEGLSRISSLDLADAVIREVGRRLLLLDATTAAGQSVNESYESLSVHASDLERENNELRVQLEEARQKSDKLETRLVLIEAQLEKDHRPDDEQVAVSSVAAVEDVASDVAPVPVERLPEWMKEWKEEALQKGTYDQDREALVLLARTGLARRSAMSRALGEMWDKKPSDGTLTRLYERFERGELVIFKQALNETAGGAGKQYLLKLGDKGRDICRLMFGLVPVESQLDRLIKRHKSNEHVLLNLEAGDMLRDAGYIVDLYPAPLELPSGSQFAPDLMASLDQRTLFVEVERITQKSADAWARKWEIIYEATGGEIYVVVANKRARGAMRGDILHCLGRRPLTLCMTSVSEARGRGLRGRDVWIDRWGER